MISLQHIAHLEELRQARGVAEVAPESIPLAGGTVARGAPGSWANNAVGLGLTQPITRADLDRLIDYFASKGIEPRLEVCPFVDPSVVTLAGELGFRLKQFENVFYRELNPAKPAVPVSPAPPELVLRVIDPADAAAVRDYCYTVTVSFMPEGMAPREEDLEFAAGCLRHPHTIAVGAYLGPTLTGGGTMAVTGEIVALFGASVLPDFRRRGIQQALLAHRLNLAAQKGARIATIGSLPGKGTERNVRRMGFELAYTKVILVKPGPGLTPNIS